MRVPRAAACVWIAVAAACVASSVRALTAEEILAYKGPDRQKLLEEGARQEGALVIYSGMIVNQLLRPAVTELIARTKALLRRPGGALGTTLVAGNVNFDTIARDARIGELPHAASPG